LKTRGAKLVVKAMEDEGVRFAFGIPGTHNIEIYDALDDSSITPVLVTDEQAAGFLADGVSRSSGSIGVVNLVPGAGVTHALSGIAEAFMDNIPILVLAAAIREDTGHAFQLHDIDQAALLAPVTKAVFKPKTGDDLYPMVRRAIRLAKSGSPGPVAVEVPVEFLLLGQDVPEPSFDEPPFDEPAPVEDEIAGAARLLNEAVHPAIYVGFGARGAVEQIVALAEKINAPVVTTIQGKGVFPERHPLWVWNNFGASAPRFVRTVMDRCDCLLAVGCKFGEVATASYGLTPPANLIHVDIDEKVPGRNFPAAIAIRADARKFFDAILPAVDKRVPDKSLKAEIAKGHAAVIERWKKPPSDKVVTPARFFASLQSHANENAIFTTDSGNGTFLAMEHLRLNAPGHFLSPVDFSCMGYSVPAALGAKLANPDADVIALAGDGALLMTGLEMITAVSQRVAPVVFVMRDMELAQIVQLQRTSMNRDTCSVLGAYDLSHLAKATGCEYDRVESDADLERVIPESLDKARAKKGIFVEVNIDYSRKTYFTKGVIMTNFWRLPWSERLRMIGRAAGRRLGGS
jgi:acetolactate synthase I/II/III large subunit